MNRSSTKIKSYSNRAEFAKSILKNNASKVQNNVVSDIGSGFGNMKSIVQSTGGKWQPLDYVKKIPESIIWDLNHKAPKEAKKAEVVLLLEVLEHLNNPLLGIQNISNHMEKNGILILTTPNPQSSKNTLSLFLRGALYAFQEKHIKENHVFTPWKHVVYEFLKRGGFEVLEYAIVDTQYKSRKSTSLKDWFKARIESYIEYRNPLAKGMSYGIVARKIS
ncbi:methyltransferase domain-containing protein [Tamlana sp. 2201CG12-4]|uniref:methyltransferase domain-containing protein n=1 Tax=Tamlana sp. 2201CG12-4 TaxID=3112582 RepID=UPI002DC01D45|nr:methyltransferase domain-containing protein [Tamlana sp. 2201CG12-4]MEC3907343.1 methyltransferase domain-containing protein [Tamlana sp. 2201CG12-4]